MDESAWFGSMYNVIGLVLVLGFLMTQLFNLSFLQALSVPFALIGLMVSGGGIGMVVAIAIALLALFFIYTRFSFNDLTVLAIFGFVILLLA